MRANCLRAFGDAVFECPRNPRLDEANKKRRPKLNTEVML